MSCRCWPMCRRARVPGPDWVARPDPVDIMRSETVDTEHGSLNGRGREMIRGLSGLLVGALLLFASAAPAQQAGGVLRITHRDSPASLSIHEESTNSVVTPIMSVYNNLVV